MALSHLQIMLFCPDDVGQVPLKAIVLVPFHASADSFFLGHLLGRSPVST